MPMQASLTRRQKGPLRGFCRAEALVLPPPNRMRCLATLPLLVLFVVTPSVASAQSARDLIVAARDMTAFAADGVGAPLTVAKGDSLSFVRTETAGDRYLVHFRVSGDGEVYRADADAFGIEPPDPWAVTPEATSQTRYAHGRVNVRSGPGTSNSQIAQLNRDDFVQVRVCHAGWCRVAPGRSGSDWSDGYISESLLHEDPSPAARAAIARSGRSYSSGSYVPTTDGRTCASFSSKAAAQAAYNADPIGLRQLDGDGDGDVCESTWRTRSAPRAAPTRTCYTGPRGGRYYYNSRGNKVYGC